MAKRELSSNLRNLKFMQRATQREEVTKKVEEVKPNGNFSSSGVTSSKCVVIMESDPHPGAVKGRMSFLSFNPAIDKLNEQGTNPCESATSTSFSGLQREGVSFGDNESPMDGAGCSSIDEPNIEAIGDLKRKQTKVISESQYPNESPKTDEDDLHSQQSRIKGFKKPKNEKLDFNLLRRGSNSKKKR